MTPAAQAALDTYDRNPLGSRYWSVFALLSLLLVAELLDFFIVGFLMTAVAPQWQLTFAQTAAMLLSTGVGAMLGAITLGKLADRIGRKPIVLIGGTLCCLASASVAFVGERQWELFTLLRFFVGVGYGSAGIAQFALIIELTPTRHRTLLASAAAISPAIGLIFASFLSAALFELVGWRGLALATGSPIVVVLAIALVVPESFRWLVAQGRYAAARVSLSRMRGSEVADFGNDVATGAHDSPARPSTSLSELYREPRKFWLILIVYFAASTGSTGVYLWGPTIVAQLLQMTPGQAAGYFALVGVGGLIGRIIMTLSAARFGRKPVATVAGLCAGVLLVAAGILNEQFIGAMPVFLICLIIGAVFYDGAFANLQPYAGELYPVRMGGRAMGLSQVGSGAGKLAGPAILALLAGSGNLVAPKAISAAVLPGFLTLGGILIAGGLVVWSLGVETRGAALALDPNDSTTEPR